VALTIKNPETVELARTLARQTGTTQTGAITAALRQALDSTPTRTSQRAAQVQEILHQVWARQSSAEAKRIKQNTDNLYNQRGLPK